LIREPKELLRLLLLLLGRAHELDERELELELGRDPQELEELELELGRDPQELEERELELELLELLLLLLLLLPNLPASSWSARTKKRANESQSLILKNFAAALADQ